MKFGRIVLAMRTDRQRQIFDFTSHFQDGGREEKSAAIW